MSSVQTTGARHEPPSYCSGRVEKIGISPLPMAKRGPRAITFRAMCKALQLSVVTPFAQIASLAGAGPSMEAVFAKPVSHIDKATGVSGGKA